MNGIILKLTRILKVSYFTMTEIKGEQVVGQSSHINLINEDCLSAMSQIADNSIDMILCDLPYG